MPTGMRFLASASCENVFYDATCPLMSSQQGGIARQYIEPNPELSFRNFAAMLSARAAAFVKLKGA